VAQILSMLFSGLLTTLRRAT